MKIYLRGMESKLVPYSSENLKGLDWIAYREFIEGIRLLKGLNLYDKQERWGDRIIKKAEKYGKKVGADTCVLSFRNYGPGKMKAIAAYYIKNN